ncbi:ABC transporter permease [Citricoccus sp. SGAir0253]|uniref:ABC transporter permease n=1 Tax=Citricoccus sp. SGAir0253 TaxID=2567881 RepID=UPI0010CD1614|nr:ABC transporter permease [Citricoccus sp. SGAir0253]QCU78349.1 ABC transporter permease [Citricoccus sp. SGAir0253]
MAQTGHPDDTSTAGVRRYTVERGGLIPVGRRPTLGRYLKQLWDFRSFILFDSQSRVASGNTEETLGKAWMVLNPILNGATYFLVFGLLLGTGRGVENFIAYLIIGVFMFRFTTQSILNGARSINNNRAIVQAFHFPRATLPIATCVRELLANVPAYVVMFVLILAIPPLEPITWKWLLFIPAVILQFLFNIGLSLLLARIVTQVKDFAHLISFGTRLWLYLSAVFYAADRFASVPVMMAFMEANPMFCLLDIAREVLLYDALPSAERWLVLGAWTVGLLVVGTVVFWKAEEAYGREI